MVFREAAPQQAYSPEILRGLRSDRNRGRNQDQKETGAEAPEKYRQGELNEREPKYDIRDWNADHTRMSKGISMTEEEMQKLVELFNARDEEDSFE